jgi:hypothetical protein
MGKLTKALIFGGIAALIVNYLVGVPFYGALPGLGALFYGLYLRDKSKKKAKAALA